MIELPLVYADLFIGRKDGDIIKGDAGTWVARTCPNCLGSGLESNYILTYKCPQCNGQKVIWVKMN